MKRYKLLNDKDYFSEREKKPKEFKVGNVFKENYEIEDGFTVEEAVDSYPDDWELVEEDKVLESAKELIKEINTFKDNTKPDHYKGKGIQPIDLIESMNLGFREGNIVKYVSRYKDKNGLEDLLKAQVYLERIIKELENERKKV